MLFIKFGKKEHLEQLRNGIVHFSTLKTFQKDPTSFRGDKMEGRLYIDPKQPMLVNGLDISSFMSVLFLTKQIAQNFLFRHPYYQEKIVTNAQMVCTQ